MDAVDVVEVVVTETLLVEDAPAEEEVREVVEWGSILKVDSGAVLRLLD